MKFCLHPAVTFLFTTHLIFFTSVVHAKDDAFEWLIKISQAARKSNYEGTFVYQHGAQLETMRIVHQVKDGAVQERLVSLNGVAREVIRNDREVHCYLPDKNSIVVEHRNADGKSFPAIVPERLHDLSDNYAIALGGSARVTGRLAQRVIIKPRDEYRYGYDLWADRETGLLLKADLLNNKGEVVERFMFTDIKIGVDIAPSALTPQAPHTGMVWYRDTGNAAPGLTQRWRAAHLPKGFKLSMRMMRKMPMRDKSAEHLVYTDGLAAVSVFIEKQDGRARPDMDGPSRMGAMYALGKAVNSHHATVIGEVPAKTVALIGSSIVPESIP